jgi:hypothetical protein
MDSEASVDRVVPNGHRPARAAARQRDSQLLGRARAAQLRADRIADGRLPCRLVPAFRARAQVGLDDGPLVGGCRAIDVRRKKRIDFPATRHSCCL